jgi:hypothetical protein
VQAEGSGGSHGAGIQQADEDRGVKRYDHRRAPQNHSGHAPDGKQSPQPAQRLRRVRACGIGWDLCGLHVVVYREGNLDFDPFGEVYWLKQLQCAVVIDRSDYFLL